MVAEKTQLRIMHCGDIHLGGIYSSMSAEQSAFCRRRLLDGFCKCVQSEIKDGVSVVLISGDLFDNYAPDTSVVSAVIKLFSENPETSFVIAPGECDCNCSLFSSHVLPKNVFVFTSASLKRITISKKNVAVYGWSMKKAHKTYPLAGRVSDSTPCLKLVVGHCDADAEMSNYFSVLKEDIETFGAHYCAFSHQHYYKGVKTAGNCLYSSSGFFEGRNFDEPGFGGYIILQAENTDGKWNVTPFYKNFKEHRYEKIKINVDGCVSASEVISRAVSEISSRKYGENTTLQITFAGNVAPTVIIPQKPDELVSLLFSVKIVNETLPLFDCGEILQDKTVLGSVFRRFYPQMNSQNKNKQISAAASFRTAYLALTGGDIKDA